MQFKIGLWSADTRHHYFTPGNIHDRISSIRKAIMTLDSEMGKGKTSENQKVRGIFVAPEYFFTQKEGGVKDFKKNTVTDKQLNETQRDQCVEILRSISADYPHILIVPGTIVWSKSLNAAGKNGADRRARAVDHMKHYIKRGESNYKMQNLDKDNNKLADSAIIIGEVKFGRYPYETSKLTAAGRLEKLEKDGNQGGAAYYMRNTAYVLLNGQVVYRYHKNGDFFESSNNMDIIFVPSKKDPITSIMVSPGRELSFGFEICLDHQIESLKSFLSSSNKKNVDIHILNSATVTVDPNYMCMRPGGYFLHASDDKDATGMWIRKNNMPSNINPEKIETIDDFQMKFYSIYISDAADEAYIEKIKLLIDRYLRERTIFASDQSKRAVSVIRQLVEQRDAASLREHVDWYLGRSTMRPENAGDKIPTGKKLFTILQSA